MERWTIISTKTLISYIKAGYSYSEVGTLMNKSAGSIRLKANRLGLKTSDYKKNKIICDKICLRCSVKFTPSKGLINYCSMKCRQGKNWSTEHKKKLSNIAKTSPKALLAQKKRKTRIDKYCPCGKLIKYDSKLGCCNICLYNDPYFYEQLKKSRKGKVGGYRKKGGSSHHIKGYYKDIWMDSSWETAMAIRLDELNIIWERNSSIYLNWYDDKGISHKYYPDFYLPKENLYIEVKGYWTEYSKIKMALVQKQNDVNIIILETLKNIKTFII